MASRMTSDLLRPPSEPAAESIVPFSRRRGRYAASLHLMNLYNATVLHDFRSREWPSRASSEKWRFGRRGREMLDALVYLVCQAVGRLLLSLLIVSSTARDFLTRPPTGRYFSPALPSDCFAIDFPGRAMCPGEGLPRPRCVRTEDHQLPSHPLSHIPAAVEATLSYEPVW